MDETGAVGAQADTKQAGTKQTGTKQEALPRPSSTAASRAVAAARGSSNDKRNLLLGIGIVVVLAILIAAGIVYASSAQKHRGTIPVSHAAAQYPATPQPDGTVVAGQPGAKVKIDVYEDFLCPYCGMLEVRDGAKIEQALGAGSIQVTYHPVSILDENSQPAGYSSRAANAALAAAAAGKWADYHHSLFAQDAQPRELSAGYDAAALIALGQDLGITDAGFAAAVNGGTYAAAISKVTQDASTDPALVPPGRAGFSTPTVTHAGAPVGTRPANWLDTVIATGH